LIKQISNPIILTHFHPNHKQVVCICDADKIISVFLTNCLWCKWI